MIDSFRVGPSILLWGPLSALFTQRLLSVVSSPEGPAAAGRELTDCLSCTHSTCSENRKKNSSNSCTLQNTRIPRETRPPDSWFSRGLLSTSRNTSSCYKGKTIQLALVEASSFPTGVNWVPCMLFWTWLNIRRYLFPDCLPLQRGRQRHIQGLQFTLHAPVLHLGENAHREGFAKQVTGQFFFLGLKRKVYQTVSEVFQKWLRM